MSSGIKNTDSDVDRFAKVLPADVTAAFISVQTGLNAAMSNSGERTFYIVASFFVILLICPFYFAILLDVKSKLQNVFLCASFAVFGISIAHADFQECWPDAKTYFSVSAIVLPIVWAFLITPMFVKLAGNAISSTSIEQTGHMSSASVDESLDSQPSNNATDDPNLRGTAIPLNPT